MLNPQLNLNPNWQTAPKDSTRAGFGDALVQLGKINPKVVVLTADLKDSTKADAFTAAFPNRFFDTGVAEQNLMGVSAGLAASGLIPFCTSYAVFSPGRNWEQLRNTVCYSHLNVKVASTHAGLSVGPDGATHQALEDIALTRTLPNLTVISPADYHQAYRATIAAARHTGPVYLRLSRESALSITTTSTPFDLGAAQILRFGSQATIVTIGLMVGESLRAAEEIDAEVINIHTIKPLDIDAIMSSVKKTGKLIVAEEHQQAGGLGSVIFETFVHRGAALPPTKHIAVTDQFGQSGDTEELFEAYGLTWHHIVDKYSQFR
jgi:transketolase